MSEGEEFIQDMGQFSLKCQLQAEWVRIEVDHDGHARYAAFSQAQMAPQLLELFGDVPTFYKCFKKICEAHQKDSPTVMMDSKNSICGTVTQRVYHASTKRTFSIPTQILRSLHNSDVQEVEWSQMLSRSRTVQDLKQCLQLLEGRGKSTRQRVQEGGFQLNELKKSVKELEYQVYRLSVRNNELTQCINEISKLTNQQFKVVQQFLNHVNSSTPSMISPVKAAPQRSTLNSTPIQSGLDLQSLLQGRSNENKKRIQGITEESKQQMSLMRKHVPELKWMGLEGSNRLPISIDTTTPHFRQRCDLRDQVMAKLNSDTSYQFIGNEHIPLSGKHYFAVKRMKGNGVGVGVVDSKHSQAEQSSSQKGCWCYFGSGRAMVGGEKIDQLREWKKDQTLAVIVDRQNLIIKWLIEDIEVCRANLPPSELATLLPYIQLGQRGPRLELNM